MKVMCNTSREHYGVRRSVDVNKHGGGVNDVVASHVNNDGGRLASGGHLM